MPRRRNIEFRGATTRKTARAAMIRARSEGKTVSLAAYRNDLDNDRGSNTTLHRIQRD